MGDVKFISVVIPVFNEEECIPELIGRLQPVLEGLQRPYEVVFVDDGSRDRTLDLLKGAIETWPQVKVVELTRNYGQHAALFAGFSVSKGEIVVTMDADLQNPPEEIPKLLRVMEEGNYEVIGTVRKNRQDTLFRTIPSRIVNRIARRIMGINMTDWGCMPRVYQRRIVERMLSCHEQSTFIPALATYFAKRVTEVEVAHEERRAGVSHYSLKKLIDLQFDLISSFSDIPLKFIMYAGIIMALLGLSMGTGLLLARLFYGPHWAVEGVLTIDAFDFAFEGFEYFALGVIGEYISRIYREVRRRPEFVIEEIYQAANNRS